MSSEAGAAADSNLAGVDYADLLQCPSCGGDLDGSQGDLACLGCLHRFPLEDGIPQLFWPNEWPDSQQDVTEIVKQFYEETPFPNYDELDSVESLSRKARQGVFARMLDEQVPPGARILECGCGTGQLSCFLSIANRRVFASDMCMNSLRLGRDFAADHGLSGVRFVQMNLFRPAFKQQRFHLVISNGVLHHTSDPRLAFRTIADLVVPGGFVLIGLYHRYGRLITDVRRTIFRMSGQRWKSLDPNLRREETSQAKKRAWFADQYEHPHESKHTIGEAMGWLRESGFDFVKSIPRARPFQPIGESDSLFAPEQPGIGIERFLVELGMVLRGSREGGFFVVIGKKRRG